MHFSELQLFTFHFALSKIAYELLVCVKRKSHRRQTVKHFGNKSIEFPIFWLSCNRKTHNMWLETALKIWLITSKQFGEAEKSQFVFSRIGLSEFGAGAEMRTEKKSDFLSKTIWVSRVERPKSEARNKNLRLSKTYWTHKIFNILTIRVVLFLLLLCNTSLFSSIPVSLRLWGSRWTFRRSISYFSLGHIISGLMSNKLIVLKVT